MGKEISGTADEHTSSASHNPLSKESVQPPDITMVTEGSGGLVDTYA
jgi:hypothetical protein